MLTPFVPYSPIETVQSYAERLSSIHTGQPAARLLTDCGVNVGKFRTGDPDAIALFAAAIGEDEQVLQAATIRTLSRYKCFRGSDYSPTFLTSRVRQFCPHCLREDGHTENWRFRLTWCFSPIAVCALHGVNLAEVAGAGMDDGRQAVEMAGGFEVLLQATVASPIGNDARWLQDRIAGQSAGRWLDGQTIEEVLTASEMIGLVLEHGQQVRPAKLARSVRQSALSTGFDIYKEGPSAVRLSLDEIRNRSTATAVQAGPLAIYGVIFDWLDRRSGLISPGPIKEIVREHILDHDAYMEGQRLLGEVVSEQRLHSIKSLSATLKMDRRRMSRLLQKIGLVPVGATDAETGRLVFPIKEVEQLVRDFDTAVPLVEVADYLGGSGNQVLAIYRSGLLPAVVPADAPGAVRRVVFARRVLEEFLATVGELPVAAAQDGADMLSVAEACQRHGGTADDLLAAVFAGLLPAFRLPGKPRLQGIIVRPRDVMALRQPQEGQSRVNG